jgi:hypothetical protein
VGPAGGAGIVKSKIFPVVLGKVTHYYNPSYNQEAKIRRIPNRGQSQEKVSKAPSHQVELSVLNF